MLRIQNKLLNYAKIILKGAEIKWPLQIILSLPSFLLLHIPKCLQSSQYKSRLKSQHKGAAVPRTQSPRRVAAYRTSSISIGLENSELSQDYGEHLAPLCTSFHMATRALANLSHEGNKVAKRPRGHMITGLLQFEILL